MNDDQKVHCSTNCVQTVCGIPQLSGVTLANWPHVTCTDCLFTAAQNHNNLAEARLLQLMDQMSDEEYDKALADYLAKINKKLKRENRL